MSDITPISKTSERVVLTPTDYEKLMQSRPDPSTDPPSVWGDGRAFRVIDGDVYEVHHDSWGNPYLKYRGVLIENEVEAYD